MTPVERTISSSHEESVLKAVLRSLRNLLEVVSLPAELCRIEVYRFLDDGRLAREVASEVRESILEFPSFVVGVVLLGSASSEC